MKVLIGCEHTDGMRTPVEIKTISRRKDQIEWLVSYYYDNNLRFMDSSDFELECAFIEGTRTELKRSLWLDRLRGCANRLGLRPTRMYNWGGGHGSGIPRYSVSYS